MTSQMTEETKLSISVMRDSFFGTSKGTLRYAEHSPAMPCEEKQICNCTRSVAERPLGEPDQVQQTIKFEEGLGDYAFELSLGHLGPWFTFRWRGPEKGWNYKAEPEWAHAYFMSGPGRLNIEITVPGYGLTDHFFGHVFFGNRVDVSALMNGHSPSRIVDLSKVPDDQVWAHMCNWGVEAVSPFVEGEETRRWREVKKEIDEIASAAEGYNRDLPFTVDGIRLRVMDDEPLLRRVVLARDWFVSSLRRLKDTEMWRACDEANNRTERKSRRSSNQRR